ncbi:hypothetical protein [Streptomyces lydicus]|uniref:hypothetical protein n=1 Tax=Streptomyces lydicus TaxID=47763 RepID=UPI00101018BA|nr:hypothetical protein [Streptomyces lydicus]MCZ1012009.1 hypothetical protein [Streptomyces lydicus]
MTAVQPVQHHPDRLLPSSADELIRRQTGLDLPALLDSTHPLARPLRLIRMQLVLVERTLREISDTTARSIAVRRELLDAGHLSISPLWAPPESALAQCLGERVGIINSLNTLLDCWQEDLVGATKTAHELSPQETGERENCPRTDTAPRAQEDNR